MLRIVKHELSTLSISPNTREDKYFNPIKPWIPDQPWSLEKTAEFELIIKEGPRQGVRKIYALDLRLDGEEQISLALFIHRSRSCLSLTESHGRTLLMNNLIPLDWKGYRLVFAGTLYKSFSGEIFVPCACWSDKKKEWETDYIAARGDKIGGEVRAVVADW